MALGALPSEVMEEISFAKSGLDNPAAFAAMVSFLERGGSSLTSVNFADNDLGSGRALKLVKALADSQVLQHVDLCSTKINASEAIGVVIQLQQSNNYSMECLRLVGNGLPRDFGGSSGAKVRILQQAYHSVA
ncbi:unnamed protein product, partial [Ectocarpus fasciculatus]